MQFGRGKPSAGAFFDTDFATIDSLLALAVLHGMSGKNDCRVAIVTMSRPNLAVTAYIDMVERFYRGRPGNFAQVPPIGMRTAGEAGETSPAYTVPFQKKKSDGTPAYASQVRTVIDTGDPNTLIRNYLEAQYDQNGFMVLAGPATNLAAALEFRGVRDLITSKIKYLSVALTEHNVKADIPAAKKLFAEWPTPVTMLTEDVGVALPFPGASIDKEFAAAVPDNPVADAYRANRPMPYDAPSTAMAAALYAGRPKEGYFKVSDPGTIAIHDDGRVSFTTNPQGKHQQLMLDPAQKDTVLKAYVDLASAKPVIPQRFRPPVKADVDKKDDISEKK